MKLICAFAILAFSAAPALAQDIARMEQVIQAAVDKKTFMGSVLVARGNDILLNKGYGQADLEWEIANTPTTRFRLGSITKQFTAASILLLEERGKLRIEDPIKQHLPDVPAAWDAITIYNLLTHTSGIPNFTALPEYQKLKPFASAVEKTLEVLRDKPLDFAPGERMSYSNSGYLVLGRLIEKITGASYAAFVRENIFVPLGMKDSGFDSNSEIIARRAAGYSPGPSGPINAGFIHMTIPHAAGSLYSTTEDLLRWQQGLFAGKVLSVASLQKMITPFKESYALGVGVRAMDGRKAVTHGGGIEGFNTILSYYPDSRITVAVLANINGPAADQIGRSLGALAHGDTVTLNSERKEIVLPAATLARYVGDYEMTPKMLLTISLDGDSLMAQLTGQGKLQIYPEAENAFFLKVVDAQIEFVTDANGTVTHAVLHQGGRDLKGTRKR
jgi:CubicO group peptidase (beta-lactamase class C family)